MSSIKNTLMSDATFYNDSAEYVDSFNKILLIEDNPGDARLVELLLEETDLIHCEITNKITLEEGMVALSEESNFAAILLDLTLPDSHGFETLEKLLEKFPNNNVIVLTGLADKSLGIRAVKAGAQDFLVKGDFDSDVLAKTLRYSIERKTVINRLEEAQRIAHIGNWEFDYGNKIFTASDEVYRIFGLKPRKTVFNFEDLKNPDNPFHFFCEIHRKTKELKTFKEDLRIKHVDGDSRYLFIQCTANKGTNQALILNGIIQDITDRKNAEQEMAKSQERYQDIFTKSKDPIYICSMDGKFLDLNDATTKFFGKSKEELFALDAHKLFSPRDAKDSFLEKLRNKKSVQDFELEVERGQEIKYCLVTARELDSGKDGTYNAVIRDVTELRQADEMRKARDLAQQSAKLKEQFIASISHEMRTPMNAILGMSNLVLKTDLKEEQFNYINSVKQSSEILLGIINDILEISTLQNGKVSFEYKAFNLHELLSNLVNVMQYKIEEKDLEFEMDIGPGVPKFIEGDKLRLNQILYNLVGNAIKFTDTGHVRLLIRNINESQNTVQVKFNVIDSGIGIPEDKLGAVFETFTRIKQKERLYEGTGLGLSIAKSLVEQQGGKIGVTSEFGKGSIFYFDIIFERGNEEDLLEPPKVDNERTLPGNTNLRLLLVEDHKINQLVAKKTLEKQWKNIQLTIADNGQIAIDILREKEFDIILMDIQMPVMDGYEATEYIRNKMPPEIASLPILAMTAHANIAKDDKFKEYGLDDYVLKPFEPEQLFQKIAKYAKQS